MRKEKEIMVISEKKTSKAKKLMSLFLAFVMSFGICSTAFATGDIPEGYTPIYSEEDLNAIKNNLSGKFILMNNIDLSEYESWEPIGNAENPFSGELDGNGFYIQNMTIEDNCTDLKNYYGLFGVVADAILKNVIIVNGKINLIGDSAVSETNVCAGMIAGMAKELNSMSLTGCSATGEISINGFNESAAGGLIGAGVLGISAISSSSYVDINVTTSNKKQGVFVGGLVGAPEEGFGDFSGSYLKLNKSANYGNIKIDNTVSSEETQISVAGITSYQLQGNKIIECYNRGNISVAASTGNITAGGIAAKAVSRIEKSYNSGNIDFTPDENDVVSAVCMVEKVGGLARGPVLAQDYLAYNCYYSNSELIPCNQNEEEVYTWYKNIVLLTEEEMKEQQSFAKLDFESGWEMEEDGYPVLKEQPLICLNKTVSLEEGQAYSADLSGSAITSDSSVVSLDTENNRIVAKSAGTATVKVEYDYNYSAEIVVNVAAKEIPTNPDGGETTTNPDNGNQEPPTECWLIKILKQIFDFLFNIVTSVLNFIF